MENSCNEVLDVFFSKRYEDELNYKMQELTYVLPKDDVVNYVRRINMIDINQMLLWIDNHSFFTLDSSDMPQLSSYEDAFYNVVFEIIDHGDTGFRMLDIGKMLQDDGISRTDIANRKYGENHAKAACYLGYLYCLKYRYFSSCIGYIINLLNEKEQEKLFVRMLMRTNLFKAIYLCSQEHEVDFRQLFDMLSDKTYGRRLSGTQTIIESLRNNNEYNFSTILNRIKY